MQSRIYERTTERRAFRRELERNSGCSIGYYGLAGIGKSTLSEACAADARAFTPYVVKLDFEPGKGNCATATTATSVFTTVLKELEAIPQSY